MVSIFKALAEESRLRILALVMRNEMCVCEIETCLNMTQSNTSRHLMTLKQSGILESDRKAQWAYFHISDSFKQEQKELYEYLQRKVKELPTYQKDYEKYLTCREMNICNNNNNPH